MRFPRTALTLAPLASLIAMLALPAAPASADIHNWIDCSTANNCAEVGDSQAAWGSKYVGHDEPSVLFYSSHPGAGNRMQYQLTLPTDPAYSNTTGSFNFQLHPAFWFGMAMCDTQSYPEAVSNCTPDSDSNITTLATHPGTAFMEMQFYPPGWVTWPAGDSCDPTMWCAALNIDSLSEDPIHGTTLNNACQDRVGIEYVNFAFITRSGVAQAPANPVDATAASFTPDPSKDLFMKSGDRITVTMHDTAHGLFIGLNDLTSGQSGSMTASAANSFGQVQYAAAPSSTCNNIPYDFHPMYSTSSPDTRVPWAAHTYNIAFADEIGHFDYCTFVPHNTGNCQGQEGGNFTNLEANDGDDTYCFNPPAGNFVQVSGCQGTNTPGFDGVPYQNAWPTDTANASRPSPILFSSPTTGASYSINYSRAAFEADLPRIEASDFGGSCDRLTGKGCTRIPPTDDGQPATFYPFFSALTSSTCNWAIGDLASNATTQDFGQNAEYGSLLFSNYLVFGGGGSTFEKTNNYRQILSSNPCPA